MAALRWDQHRDDLGPPEPTAPATGPIRGPHMATAEHDDPARGIVLGVATSLLGFWLPLAGVMALRRAA